MEAGQATMNNFPLKGDLNAVRTWLNNEGYDDKCLTENWDAEALLGADKEIISKNFQLPEEEGRLDTLWSLLATARRREGNCVLPLSFLVLIIN